MTFGEIQVLFFLVIGTFLGIVSTRKKSYPRDKKDEKSEK
jgi:hypothetical protein